MDNKFTNKIIQNIMIVQTLIMSVLLIGFLEIDNQIVSILKIILLAFAIILAVINLRFVLLKRKSN